MGGQEIVQYENELPVVYTLYSYAFQLINHQEVNINFFLDLNFQPRVEICHQLIAENLSN